MDGVRYFSIRDVEGFWRLVGIRLQEMITCLQIQGSLLLWLWRTTFMRDEVRNSLLSFYKSISPYSAFHLYFPDLFLPCSQDPPPEWPPWEVRPCQPQCLSILLSSSPTTPSCKHLMGCPLCPLTTSPTSMASVLCTPYTCTSGLWGTRPCTCPAPPSPKCPVCQAWWMHAFSCQPSHSSHMSSSPSKRPPM